MVGSPLSSFQVALVKLGIPLIGLMMHNVWQERERWLSVARNAMLKDVLRQTDYVLWLPGMREEETQSLIAFLRWKPKRALGY
jgi:hypothetical protein